MEVETVAQQLFFSTIRMEMPTTTSSGLTPGTAFVFSYQWDDKTFLCLVTNKHVVADSVSGIFFFTVADGNKPLIGRKFHIVIDNFEKQWHGHPDSEADIAVMPLVPIIEKVREQGQEPFFRAIQHTLIPTPDQLDELDAIEEIVFIGYPSGIYDAKNLIPVARRGTTATPLQLDYNGRPVFLIDASVFPGSSGSPVLIVNTGSYASQGHLVVGNRVLFLGVVAETHTREESGHMEFISTPPRQVPVVKTRQMIDLGVVYKSQLVAEAVVDLLKTRNLL